jgi:methionine biosynthesis protein MetW
MDQVTDNRNYDYSEWINEDREDYKYVVELVEEGSKIIDLGCGNGSLMQKLIKEKRVTASGVELSPTGVEVCRGKGLNVIQGRIDEKLPFADNEFDYAVCNVTIQMVMYPEVLIK